MVFEGYQYGYNGSHIIYSNGTGIAFMNVHGALDSYRFITFLHLTPFFLTTVSNGWFHVGKEAKFGDNVSKMLLMGIKDHYNALWCGHGFRHNVRKIDRWMSRGQLERKANIPRDMFSRRTYCVPSDDHWNNMCTDPTQYAPLVAYCVCRVHKMLQRSILCMQGTQYATKRSILCRGAFCGPTKPI